MNINFTPEQESVTYVSYRSATISVLQELALIVAEDSDKTSKLEEAIVSKVGSLQFQEARELLNGHYSYKAKFYDSIFSKLRAVLASLERPDGDGNGGGNGKNHTSKRSGKSQKKLPILAPDKPKYFTDITPYIITSNTFWDSLKIVYLWLESINIRETALEKHIRDAENEYRKINKTVHSDGIWFALFDQYDWYYGEHPLWLHYSSLELCYYFVVEDCKMTIQSILLFDFQSSLHTGGHKLNILDFDTFSQKRNIDGGNSNWRERIKYLIDDVSLLSLGYSIPISDTVNLGMKLSLSFDIHYYLSCPQLISIYTDLPDNKIGLYGDGSYFEYLISCFIQKKKDRVKTPFKFDDYFVLYSLEEKNRNLYLNKLEPNVLTTYRSERLDLIYYFGFLQLAKKTKSPYLNKQKNTLWATFERRKLFSFYDPGFIFQRLVQGNRILYLNKQVISRLTILEKEKLQSIHFFSRSMSILWNQKREKINEPGRFNTQIHHGFTKEEAMIKRDWRFNQTHRNLKIGIVNNKILSKEDFECDYIIRDSLSFLKFTSNQSYGSHNKSHKNRWRRDKVELKNEAIFYRLFDDC